MGPHIPKIGDFGSYGLEGNHLAINKNVHKIPK